MTLSSWPSPHAVTSSTEPVPSLDWIDHVDTDPIRALEMLVLGWYPAEEVEPNLEAPTDEELAGLPPSLAAFHRLARLRPALHRFSNPVLEQPRRAERSRGGLLVFAVENQGCRDWSIPWPPQGGPADVDPPVWFTEDPYGDDDPEMILEAEPLSRFLLQFTLDQASGIAPFNAWTYVMPVERLEPLSHLLRPVPLAPWLPTYGSDLFYAAPGLLASISADETEATAVFAARDREVLASLRAYDFPWSRFDG
ncbi:hypothetical protein SNE510_74690 [Streptomyces sp. NE5-10]|uniref:hypothetical protein n=1 Tax=Streptomyces sp. NE5-10 TaxID=2759674 RepID=UPI0019061EEC|nr:hypothetical protein [Streptomyces sp. NE5-10]GHJ97950.1 hypothetical protein SNE510_74690 [Streptomyces sp. NE5-10]